jgi:hypothetical protein
MNVKIRRQWNHWEIAEVELADLDQVHWDNVSGGVRAPANQYYLHGFVFCDRIKGEIPHSCAHGMAPHSIKVCIVKKDNDPKVLKRLEKGAGPKPASSSLLSCNCLSLSLSLLLVGDGLKAIPQQGQNTPS